MRRRTGITKEYDLAYTTYALVAIFGSISFASALFTVVCVFFAQLISYPILGLCRKIMPEKYLSAICVFVCAVTGLSLSFVSRSYMGLQETSITPFFSNGLLLLLCAFLFVDQHSAVSKYSARSLVIQNALLASVMIGISIIREIFGQGTLYKIKIFDREPCAFLGRSFGGAMLLFAFLLIAATTYRYIHKENFSIKYLSETSSTYRKEKMDFTSIVKLVPTFILIVLFSAAASLISFIVYSFVLPSNTSVEMILLIYVVLQTLLACILCPVISRMETDNNLRFCNGWVCVLQVLLTALPYNMHVLQDRDVTKIPLIMIGLVLYQVLAWQMIGIAFLFVRAFRRKGLFWQIHEGMEGVPFFVLNCAIFLLLFSGMKSIGEGILERVIYYIS